MVAALAITALAAPSLMGSSINLSSSNSPSVTKSIVDSVITVKDNSSNAYPIVVPSDATNVKISGNFLATEGPGDDYARAMVMNSSNYAVWFNTRNASYIFDSGFISGETTSVALPNGAGTYYIVYQSPITLYSTEAISTQVSLSYSQS